MLSGLWLMALLLPASYWISGIYGKRKATATALLVVGLAGGLAGIPLLPGFDPILGHQHPPALLEPHKASPNHCPRKSGALYYFVAQSVMMENRDWVAVVLSGLVPPFFHDLQPREEAP